VSPIILPSVPTTIAGAVILVLGLIILWIAVSIPVYFAGKVIKGWKASFGDAMVATLGGALVYLIVYYVVSILLGGIVGAAATSIGFVLALVAWLAVYRAAFNTGWLGAFGIVIVAWIVFLVIDFVLIALFGVAFPNFIPF
jgi:hypothetical protein